MPGNETAGDERAGNDTTEWNHHRATTTAGIAVAIGLSVWAAFTTPFTTSADTVTAIGLGLVTIEVAARWRRPVMVHVASAPGRGHPGLRWWPWAALGAALLAFELLNLFLGPRIDHPTVSSLYDSATRWRPVIAACFFGWLCLGAALVRS
jgi:hypothetical protein